jgi:hypothetical protein
MKKDDLDNTIVQMNVYKTEKLIFLTNIKFYHLIYRCIDFETIKFHKDTKVCLVNSK